MTQEHAHHVDPRGHHDWHSQEYVKDWIERDVTRDGERLPHLQRMVSMAPFAKDAAIDVLDIGGGYGIVSNAVLEAFPNARVTLQDYSPHMLDQSRERLSAYTDRVTYVQSDFSTSGWIQGLEGKFDLAVSAIAIHNLRLQTAIAQVYADTRQVLKPMGAFMNYELVQFSGGVDAHMDWLRQGGFSRVECPWQEGPQAILAAYV